MIKIQRITNNYIIMALLLGIFFGTYGESQELILEGGQETGTTPDQRKLQRAQEQFNQSLKLLSQEAQNIIIERCGKWDGLGSVQKWKNWLKQCEQRVKNPKHFEFLYLKQDFREQETWAQVFPEEDNPDLPPLSQSMNDHIEKGKLLTNNYHSQITYGGLRRGAGQDEDNTASLEYNILKHSEEVAFLEKMGDPPFLGTRKEFLRHYGCDEETGGGGSPIRKCYNDIVAQQFPKDKNCIKNRGFKVCRPFLKGGCDPKAVLALESELSQEDKTGMTYICWKAATQGAQCCMNPDQCPTDGAFRGIASQLQKAAPGLVKAFAGLEAIKGDYQKACEANLLANAAGPLGQLKTKTCGDSASACEETCDKAVQDFKERFKQAVMGQQSSSPNRRGTGEEEKPITIDEIVNAAKAIEENDLTIAKEDVDTCSKAVVYLDNLFKDKEKGKKIKSLSEKLSHASLVDCSGEIFKYSGGGGSSGGAKPSVPGMNPMAAQMCRQGNPNGPAPRFPVVGPTPNPRTNQAFLTGGKTIAPGGDFVAPGTPGAPGDEFIEPERGPAGSGALQGGWTDTGGSGMGPGGGGPGGGGLTGSPSRDEGGGNGGTGDNLPMAYPEGFDMGSGGLSGGGDLSAEDAERLRMAEYMEKKDKEEERKKEEERLKEIDAQGSIFNRISQTIQEWCEKENCSEE